MPAFGCVPVEFLYYTISHRLILRVARTHAEPSRAAKEEKAKLSLDGGDEWRRAIVAPLISCRNPYLKRLPQLHCWAVLCSVQRFLYLFVALDIYVPCFIYLAGAFSLDCEASRCSAVLPGFLRKYFSTVQIGGTWAFCICCDVSRSVFTSFRLFCFVYFSRHTALISGAPYADLCFKKWR